MGVKNVARRCKKPRATKFITTGNEIYRNGQRNLSERATEILHKSLCFFRKRRAYRIFFFASALYIYALAKKKSISDSRAAPKRLFFYNKVGIKKKAVFCAPSAGWRGGERAHEKKKRLSLQKKQPLCCCGGKTRTYDLWVMSPTSYHCSTPRCRCNHSRLRVQR